MSKNSIAEEVKIEIQNRPFLPIFVNGEGPYWFVLDTGNHSSNISLEAAQTLQLKCEDKEGYVSVVEFAIGGIRWRHLVYPADLSRLRELISRSVDGVLGYFFLKDLKVTINYPEETVVVEACKGLEETLHLSSQELIELREQEYADLVKQRDIAPNRGLPKCPEKHEDEARQRDPYEVPMRIKSGDPLVPVFVDGEGPHQFILDTGASMCILSPELAETLRLEHGKTGTARGVADKIGYYSSRVKTLAVGATQRSGLEVVVADCSHITERVKSQVDGYLGHDFLRGFTVTINYPEQTLTLQ